MTDPADALLDHPAIAGRYFLPRPDRFPAPLRIPVEGAVLACSHSRGGPGRPTVVHFHGNGEVVGDWREGLPRWLDERGLDLLDARLVIGRERGLSALPASSWPRRRRPPTSI